MLFMFFRKKLIVLAGVYVLIISGQILNACILQFISAILLFQLRRSLQSKQILILLAIILNRKFYWLVRVIKKLHLVFSQLLILRNSWMLSHKERYLPNRSIFSLRLEEILRAFKLKRLLTLINRLLVYGCMVSLVLVKLGCQLNG